MKCPYCANTKSRVLDKRANIVSDVVRRRRVCIRCKKRYTTYEKIAPVELVVIKKDGRKEPFDRQKIRSGLVKALEKRPVNNEQIDKIVNYVESKLTSKRTKEVGTKIIGELVMRRLRSLDGVGYLRFASVYREFDDAGLFEKELKNLRKR